MPAQTLLDVNSDELFEKHTISEIKAINLEIQNEIEKKREELRMMVGEKCRDLLKAADIITEMKDTSENIISVISRTNELCQTLQEKRLLGFRQSVSKVSTKKAADLEEISKVVEIKILLLLPEQIWTAMDNKDYYLGAQLFLFGTHLHLGLKVTPNSQRILSKYPVFSKQWTVITNCKPTILQGASNELKVINLSHEKAAECLCSLILLEVVSYEKLLNQFLDLRMASLHDILRSEELSRKKLRQTVELLQQTLIIINSCFIDKPEKRCGVHTMLDSIVGENSQPTISKMNLISSLPEQYLSPMITKFHPKTSSKLTPLTQDHIRKTTAAWLGVVDNLLRVELTKILHLIDDIKRLHRIINEEVFVVEYPPNWDEIVQSLLGLNTLNLYDRFIKACMTNRMKELIQITWQNGLNNVLMYLNELDEETAKDKGSQQESDIRWYVWKENRVNTEEGLNLKTLGYTPRVMELCRRVDSFLTDLLENVRLYVGDDSSGLKSSVSTGNDAGLILQFLNAYSLEMIQRFTHFVKEGCKAVENESNESKIIIRARFLSCLTSQSPGLEKCLRQSVHLQEDFNENSTNNLWSQATDHLTRESTQLWHAWRTSASSRFRTLVKNKLGSDISLRTLLKSKLLSEIITIEEQTEDGTSVKSDLRVPSQPSLPLQELLFQICQQINAVAPHTLPRQIHQDLVDALVKDILDVYQDWSKSDVIYQTQAWQMLMDVKFVTLMLVTKENKDLSQSICEVLEKTIDPFDLDVYFPHLQNSVKKSTQKLQGSFGVLVNFTDKLPVFNGLKLSKGTQPGSKVEEPNLLALSTTVPWFPLLPVANFGARRSESNRSETQATPYGSKDFSGEKPGGKPGRDKENKKESVTSDFFKSAGAFFDAMTGGWS